MDPRMAAISQEWEGPFLSLGMAKGFLDPLGALLGGSSHLVSGL